MMKQSRLDHELDHEPYINPLIEEERFRLIIGFVIHFSRDKEL